MKEFLLVEEVAKMLRVSKMTIYRYIDAGKINAYKLGKEYRIEKHDYDKFLNSIKTK